jgi:hypothetical protein
MGDDIFKDNLPQIGQDNDAAIKTNGNKTGKEVDLRKTIKELKEQLQNAERELSHIAPLSKRRTPNLEGDIYYGEFDGENMVTEEGKVFAVPPNYASKSKMIEGDELKLTITPKGDFIFKQIRPADRRRIIGVLGQQENGEYIVKIGSKPYKVLLASVTYYRAQPGDEVAVIIPSEKDSDFAALDSVVSGGHITRTPARGKNISTNNKPLTSSNKDAIYSPRKPKDYDRIGTNLADKNLGSLEDDVDMKASMLNDNVTLNDDDELI